MAPAILVINPGSTSTKIAVYQGEQEQLSAGIEHAPARLDQCGTMAGQFEFRKEAILRELEEKGVDPDRFACIMARGGAGLRPVRSGGYEVNDLMVQRLRDAPLIDHASNLGGLIARSLADNWGVKAYVYDPVTLDELSDVARISGLPQIARTSAFHALNSRAMAREAARRRGLSFETSHCIVAHLGGGISLCALEKGKAVDICSDDEGPFSPERAGAVPCTKLIDLCYNGHISYGEMKKLFRGKGGIRAYLGTTDVKEAAAAADRGDRKAGLILEALSYQTAKSIGALAAVLRGKVDFIVLTGGIVRNDAVVEGIRSRVGFIAPVSVLPGENEMPALAAAALRILGGEESPREYDDTPPASPLGAPPPPI